MKLKPIYIAGDLQVSTKPCTIIGIILDHSAATSVIVYNEATSSKTAAKMVIPLRTTATELTKVIMFPEPGLWCSEGCYVDYDAGTVILIVDL